MSLLALRGDPKLVFSSDEEFLAHHTGSTVEEAAEFLRTTPPDVLHRIELARLYEKLRSNDKEAFVHVTGGNDA
jgi:hypothetical protein